MIGGSIDDITSHGGFEFVPFLITYQIPITLDSLNALKRHDRNILVSRLLVSRNILSVAFDNSYALGPNVQVQVKTCVGFTDLLASIGQQIGRRINEIADERTKA